MTYEEVVKRLKEMECMVLSKAGKKYASDSEIFYIKGTRISAIVMKRTALGWSPNPPHQPAHVERVIMKWKIKKKYKKRYADIKFEEVLDSAFVSKKAKEELVFHLDMFRKLPGR